MSSGPDSFSEMEHFPHNSGPLHDFPDGFPFGPESNIRRLAEPAAFGIFPYVAGMTVMDDRVAAAVDQHSSFMTRPWSRLARTVDSAVVLVFGSETETTETAEKLYRFHQTVRGTDGPVHYSANDADAQTWVLACLFDGLKQARQRWAPPAFTPEQEEGLYQDIRTFGHFFGIDPSLQPETAGELSRYWQDKLDNGRLLQTNTGQKMARAVFRFTSPRVPNVVARLGQAVSIVSLDPRVQEQANLRPNTTDRRLAVAFDMLTRNTYGRIPSSTRRQAVPTYMAVRRRIAPIAGRVTSSRRRRGHASGTTA